MRTPSRVAAVAVTLGLLVAACGDDDDTAVDGTTSSTADDAAGSGDSRSETVEVTAVDYAYEGLPASIPAGTQLTLRNEADAELHELVAFRLPDGETRSVEELVALPPDELLPALGGEPATVLLAPPGGDMIPAVGDGTLAEPGRYAVICIIPTGADPTEYLEKSATSDGPPEVDGGPPHITQGMFAELTVG